MYINGKGTRQIATILNYEGVPTPSQYQNLSNVSNIWIQQQVYRIINNVAYIGDMVYRKTQKKNFKSKQAIRTPESKRITYKNHHEPIISNEIFEQAQQMKAQFKKITTREISMFSGLIQCGKCGRPLIMRKRKSYDSFYECIKYHQEGVEKPHIKEHYGCISHKLYEQDIVIALMEYCEYILSQNNIAEEIQEEINTKHNQGYKETIKAYEKELKKADETIEKIYDDRLNGMIDDKLYQKKFKEYNDKKENIKRGMEELINDNLGIVDINLINEVCAKIDSKNLDNLFLKRVFKKMIYFLPDEITEQQKIRYQIPDRGFNLIKKDGGILFFMYN
jgi:hypothetical protein